MGANKDPGRVCQFCLTSTIFSADRERERGYKIERGQKIRLDCNSMR